MFEYKNINEKQFYNIINNLLYNTIKLRVSTILQKKIYDADNLNSQKILIGNIVINSTTSFLDFIALPIKLLKFWYKNNKYYFHFGKNFIKLIDIYKKYGAQNVENLLDQYSVSNRIRACIYTELSKYLRNHDIKMSAEYAWLAYKFDPHPYRLKWFAFRTYEANEVIISYIILDLLPKDTKMSLWEQNQKNKIYKEAHLLLLYKSYKLQEIIYNLLNTDDI